MNVLAVIVLSIALSAALIGSVLIVKWQSGGFDDSL